MKSILLNLLLMICIVLAVIGHYSYKLLIYLCDNECNNHQTSHFRLNPKVKFLTR